MNLDCTQLMAKIQVDKRTKNIDFLKSVYTGNIHIINVQWIESSCCARGTLVAETKCIKALVQVRLQILPYTKKNILM